MSSMKSETTIPHFGCKTPTECRREQVCFDTWHCSAAAPLIHVTSHASEQDKKERRINIKVSIFPGTEGNG